MIDSVAVQLVGGKLASGRLTSPLAQRIIGQGKSLKPSPAGVTIDYSGSAKKIAVLAPLVRNCDWLTSTSLSVNALETAEHLILAGIADNGDELD